MAVCDTHAEHLECKARKSDGSCALVDEISGANVATVATGLISAASSARLQNGRRHRCALIEIGIRYWELPPYPFNWSPDGDHKPCPIPSHLPASTECVCRYHEAEKGPGADWRACACHTRRPKPRLSSWRQCRKAMETRGECFSPSGSLSPLELADFADGPCSRTRVGGSNRRLRGEVRSRAVFWQLAPGNLTAQDKGHC